MSLRLGMGLRLGSGASGSGAAALSLTGSPTAAKVATPYSFTPTVSGGTAPYGFALQAGALPTGLSLNTSTGAITGTPTGV